MVVAQGPRLILIAPPPVDEHLRQESAPAARRGTTDRTAEATKAYADAVQELGSTLDIPVINLWSLFMQQAGWKIGDPLIGSKSVSKSEELANLLSDGACSRSPERLFTYTFPGLSLAQNLRRTLSWAGHLLSYTRSTFETRGI